MSSEISIEEAGRLKPATTRDEAVRLKPAATNVRAGAGVDTYVGAGFSRPDDGFRPWHFFVLVSILLATVAVIMARQSAPEHLILISFTIAAAGAAAGAFYRMLAPLTAPVVLQMGEPVSERTRAALEREKLLVLRSIKDLEFDRAMGKLSQKDFDEMAGRLRARAMSLMKQLDLRAAGYSDAIEQELTGRLQTEGRRVSEGRLPSTSLRAGPSTSLRAGPSTSLRAGPSTSLRAGPSTSLRAGPSTSLRAGPSTSLRAGPSTSLRAGPSTSLRAGPSTSLRAGKPAATAGYGAMVDCGACAAANDSDAVFCKKCGTRLQA